MLGSSGLGRCDGLRTRRETGARNQRKLGYLESTEALLVRDLGGEHERHNKAMTQRKLK